MKTVFRAIMMTFSMLLIVTAFNLSMSNTLQGKFTVEITVTGDDNGLPLKDTKVILASKESFWDIDLKYTGADGIARLEARYGGNYEIILYHAYYRRVFKDFKINKYGDMKNFSLSFVLERQFSETQLSKQDRQVNITVKGKDYDGSIKPLRGATVYCPGTVVTTDANGKAIFKHGYPLTTLIYFSATAPGYVPKEDGIMVGTKPAMIYEPDPLEIILEKEPLTKTQLKVLVLDYKTDKPIEGASVSLDFKKPIKINGQTKTMWSADITDAAGYADFTDATERAILVEYINTNDFAVTVSKDKYKKTQSDIPKELLTPSVETRIYTVWLTPEEVNPRTDRPFVGTWEQPYHGGKSTLTINASGSGTSEALGTGLTNGQPSKEVGTISQGVVDGQTLTCHWESTYSDGDKTITRGGTLTLTLNGDTLTATGTVDPESIKEKWNVGKYASRAKSGGTSTYTRAIKELKEPGLALFTILR
ncbi:MAG: hypothetical protein MUQ00_08190 [Candidatus Aminicenantes bacterium]|nr:hypothetical protein [Candidatus Aminicenantes bacterium]